MNIIGTEIMELSNTEQLHQAKAKLTSSMQSLEEAVNARIAKIKESVKQEIPVQSDSELNTLVESLKENVTVLEQKNKALEALVSERESAYKKLKVMSEQSVDVLDAAITKLEAYSLAEE